MGMPDCHLDELCSELWRKVNFSLNCANVLGRLSRMKSLSVLVFDPVGGATIFRVFDFNPKGKSISASIVSSLHHDELMDIHHIW